MLLLAMCAEVRKLEKGLILKLLIFGQVIFLCNNMSNTLTDL